MSELISILHISNNSYHKNANILKYEHKMYWLIEFFYSSTGFIIHIHINEWQHDSSALSFL